MNLHAAGVKGTTAVYTFSDLDGFIDLQLKLRLSPALVNSGYVLRQQAFQRMGALESPGSHCTEHKQIC